MVKIIHSLESQKKEILESEDAGFLLSNRKGDYFWSAKSVPESRYEGWFCNLGEDVFRVIESLIVRDSGEVLELKNNFTNFERKRRDLTELFYLPPFSHNFVYEISRKRQVDIFFDFRHSYSSDKGAEYTKEHEGDTLVINFENRAFLAVKAEEYENVSKNIERSYSYDKNRNSPPFSKTVCHGITVSGKRFVFSVSKNKKEAVEEANRLFIRNTLPAKEEEVDLQCVKTSLSNLLITEHPGVYAGLPWFFHFWPRDEAVSLKAILEIDQDKGKEVFLRLLDEAMKKGPGGVINIDATGWLFKRAEDVLPLLDKGEKEKVSRVLRKYIEELLWAFTEEGLATNRDKETWMDSIDRSGARIEIQAMRLNMYRLASFLAKRRSEQKLYKKMEEDLKKKVRKTFFDGENLYDGYYPYKGVVEKIIRPNIFIAAYIYPDLLTNKEWIKVFDNALDVLWLPWGGVATLDKNSSHFHNTHTGENPESYHQGDSWFYINNLTAIMLYRMNKRKYKDFIKKIMEASREEILSKGAVGSHAEVSSAKELKSEGCVNQAWSCATYLEARREIKK